MVSNIISMLMTLNCISFKIHDTVDLLEAQRRIEICIAEIKAWILMFMLTLNDDKTDLVTVALTIFSSTQ